MTTQTRYSSDICLSCRHLLTAALLLLCLTGCLPEDRILKIEFSPDDSKLAYISEKKGLNLITLKTGESKTLVRENVCGSEFSWNPQGDKIAFVQLVNNAWNIALADLDGNTSAITSGYAKCSRPVFLRDGLTFVTTESGPEEGRVWNSKTAQISMDSERTSDSDQKKSSEADLAAAKPLAPDGFSVSEIARSHKSGKAEIAFVVQSQLIAIGNPVTRKFKILTPDLQDKFVLAEEYYRKGLNEKSLGIYKEIATSVRKTYDPVLARFASLCNLMRLGHGKEAAAGLREMIRNGRFPGEVPEPYFWRTLGYCQAFDLGDRARAAKCLKRFCELSQPVEIDPTTSEPITVAAPPGFPADVLAIVESPDGQLFELLRTAIRARLDGDSKAAIPAFIKLLEHAPEKPEVRRIYLTALEGFDHEIYFFSPSQRSFEPAPDLKAQYYRRFLELAPDANEAAGIELELFVLYNQNGMVDRSRELLMRALDSRPNPGLVSESAAAFLSWIESPENQPWLDGAMRDVFLHPTIKAKLLKQLNDPGSEMLAHIAAAKLALMDGDHAAVAKESADATALYDSMTTDSRDRATETRFARVMAIRGMDAEQRGELGESSEWFDRAKTLVREHRTDEFDLYMELEYRKNSRCLPWGNLNLVQALVEIERKCGDDLVMPTWDARKLDVGLQRYTNLCDSWLTNPLCVGYASYNSGIICDKLKRPAEAREHFLNAVQHCTNGLLEKALFELSAHDEANDDPWNAARWLEQMATLASTDDYLKLWIKYKVAELHVKQGYKTQEAREALKTIITTQLQTPLGIQAQEILKGLE